MDLRSKYFLKKEDVLKCLNGDTYHIIGDPIGLGGGSVLYPAVRNGTRVHFAIKECFPNSDSQELIFIRKNGVVQPKNPEDKEAQLYLENMRKQFCQEGYSSQEISNTNGRAVGVWQNLLVDRIIVDGEEYSARDGIFMTLEHLNEKGCFLSEILEECSLPKEYGHPLRTGGLPHVYTTARIMEQLLKALDKVHQSGYLHGDVQDGNLFFNDSRLDEGDIGFGCLIDFGCARKLNKDGKTEEVSDRIIYSTLGFIAPEIIKKNDGHLRLTPAADIYSAGRLMLYLLKGKKFIRNGRDRVYTDDTLIEMLGTDCEKIGCGETAQKLINSILRNSLQPEPDDRYQDAGEMLEDVQRLVEELRPSKNRLSLGLSTLSEGEFLGREEELEQLDMSLRQHRNPIVIWGFGGMGKTELAIEFGRKKMGTCQVYFVRFDTSFYKTIVGPIADAFSGYSRYDARGREKTEEQVYEEVMKLLGELSPDDILIIDNVDSESKEISELLDDGYRALCRLSLHLIITSRTRCEGYGIEVGELKRIQLYELMERFVKINRNEMDALIDTVEAHTLTVELIARTLKYGCISVEKLLERLKYGNLDSENFIRVAVRKDRDERKKRIEEHLQCLFQIADLPEIEQNYMKNALLISNEGMDYWIFAEMLIDFEQDNMQHLIDRGWIREQGGVLWLHSLVQYVGRKQWPITFNIADSFLAKGFKLAEIIAENADDTNRFDNSWEISQIILSYLTALNYSNVKEGEKLYEKYGSVCQRVIQKKAYLLLLASSEDIGDPMENEYTDTEGVHFSLIEDRTVSYVIYEIKKYLKYPSLVYEYGVELLESTTGTIKGKNFRTFYLDHPRKNGNQLLILTYECSTNIMYINRALIIDGEVRRSLKTNVMHLVDEKFKVISNLAENGNNLSNIWDIDEENIEKEIGKSIQLIDPTKMEIPLNSIDEMVKGHTYFAFWIGGEKEKCTDSLTIAEHFENGYNGFPKNPEKARSYYEKAIEEGKVNSIYDLTIIGWHMSYVN